MVRARALGAGDAPRFGDAEHLAPFGYVSLPPLPVETLIALSILLVAVEAIHRKDGIYIESALDPQYSL